METQRKTCSTAIVMKDISGGKRDLKATYQKADGGSTDICKYYYLNWLGSVVSLLTLWDREVILLSLFIRWRKWVKQLVQGYRTNNDRTKIPT